MVFNKIKYVIVVIENYTEYIQNYNISFLIGWLWSLKYLQIYILIIEKTITIIYNQYNSYKVFNAQDILIPKLSYIITDYLLLDKCLW